MPVTMTVVGVRTGREAAFREVEEFVTRKQAFMHLRNQLGQIYGQSDEDYLESLKTIGVTVTFSEEG